MECRILYYVVLLSLVVGVSSAKSWSTDDNWIRTVDWKEKTRSEKSSVSIALPDANDRFPRRGDKMDRSTVVKSSSSIKDGSSSL